MIEILFYGLSTNKGGIENYLYKISRYLDKSIFHLNFIDETEGKACFRKELEELDCQFFDITARRISFKKNREDLRRLFLENSFDILHFNANTLSYTKPVEFALKNDVQVILHSRNGGCENSFITYELHYMNKVRFMHNKHIYRLAVSDEAGKWLFGASASYKIFNNGIIIKDFRFYTEIRKQIRAFWNLGNDFVIGNVAAFFPTKNHLFMIEVLKEILKQTKAVKMVFVGDGPYKSEIEDLIQREHLQDYIILMGKRGDIGHILAAFDSFLFPSRFEGFPNAVLEAQTSGLPVIMSDCITKEVSIQGLCTFCSLEKSPQLWAETILQIPVQTDNARELAYLKVDELGFSVESEIKKLENLYKVIKEKYVL